MIWDKTCALPRSGDIMSAVIKKKLLHPATFRVYYMYRCMCMHVNAPCVLSIHLSIYLSIYRIDSLHKSASAKRADARCHLCQLYIPYFERRRKRRERVATKSNRQIGGHTGQSARGPFYTSVSPPTYSRDHHPPIHQNRLTIHV